MATSTAALVHPGTRIASAEHTLAPVAILVSLSLLLGVLALALSVPGAGDPSIAADLRATAATVDGHADTMTADAARLAEHAIAAPSADQALWLAQAQHMTSDAASLHALAERLRGAARTLGDHPTYQANASSVTIAATASSLRDDADAAIAHGRAMIDMAAYLTTLARRSGSGITEGDAVAIGADASRIVDAGERTLQIASRVDAGADQLQRALGR